MNKKMTKEQAERLLKAIFPKEKTAEEIEEDKEMEEYFQTPKGKVSYAEYVLTHNLQYIGKALNRLSRLSRLLMLGETPKIIINNETRMALEPMLVVEDSFKEVVEMLKELYSETKEEVK